jgi:nucleoside-diphosphate-sugar epimerase
MLGRALTALLEQSGVDVLRVGRNSDDDITLDLADDSSVRANSHRADALFACAAVFGDNTREGTSLNLRVNAIGAHTAALLGDALEVSQIVYAGSLFPYAGDSATPDSSYGLSKALAETILAWACEQRARAFTSVRLPQLYDSSGACITHQPWFGRIIGYACRGLDLRLPPGGASRNFLHVDDAARVMLNAAYGRLSGIVDATHDEMLSYHEIAAIAFETFGAGGRVVVAEEKAPFRVASWPAATAGAFAGCTPRAMRDGIGAIRDCGTGMHFGPLDVS